MLEGRAAARIDSSSPSIKMIRSYADVAFVTRQLREEALTLFDDLSVEGEDFGLLRVEGGISGNTWPY